MSSNGDPERYLSVDALEDELGFDGDTFDVDNWPDLLERLLDEESERIESQDFADTAFVEIETTERVYGGVVDGTDLLLGNRPVVDVSSIELPNVDETVEPDDVWAATTHLELLGDADFDAWPELVSVEYTYGLDHVPGPVRDALVRLVRARLERIRADGVESEAMPSGQSVTYRPSADILDEVRDDLEEYRPGGYFGGTIVI